MAGPFSGMDPYLESQAAWPDFHNALIAEIRNELGARLPWAEVYRWTVSDPLPRVPIPLREPDADVQIDFAVLVNRVYDLGRYARTLRHDMPLPETTSLTPEDRAWVECQSRRSEHRNG